MKFYEKYYKDLFDAMSSIPFEQFKNCENLIKKAYDAGAKVIIAGNGGSSSIASHVTVDLVKTAAIRAINFNESNLITCFANDFGYERWVEKAIEYYSDPNDLVILISSSGESNNIINAARATKNKGLNLITLSGFEKNNRLCKIGDVNLWVNSSKYNYVEITHQIWLLSLVDCIVGNKT
jgi:D-sedoheptulose 7-phosphate isomerase